MIFTNSKNKRHTTISGRFVKLRDHRDKGRHNMEDVIV